MTAPTRHPETDEVVQQQGDDRIRCTQCHAVVTAADLAVPRGGAHEHTFRNPGGYSWTIRCFRDASGCISVGALADEATWFAGYAWCYAHCTSCARHLGWWFVGSGPSFVGLIVGRIT